MRDSLQFGEAYVTIKRLEEFMMLQEAVVGDCSVLRPKLTSKHEKYVNTEQIRHLSLYLNEEPSVEIDRVVAMYKKTVVLSNIDLQMRPGLPTIIVGPVGSGKSCMLHLILGELSILKGFVESKGTISYASQEPWLFAATVRVNILFGRPYDRERYREVVRACALVTDFTLLPFGDKTIIGERGVSLSGGQRARVNLARAVYKQADIYLLDDPLSAVDINVAQQLFHECICGYLKDKLVILVTHQLQFIRSAQQVVVLHDGVVEGCGTYESLAVSGMEFTGLTRLDEVEDEVEESKVDKPKLKIDTILKRLSVTAGKSITAISREGSIVGWLGILDYVFAIFAVFRKIQNLLLRFGATVRWASRFTSNI